MSDMGLNRELHNPLTEEEANSLTKDEKEWLRAWNRQGEIPGESGDGDTSLPDSLYPNGGDDDTASEYDDMDVADLKEELRSRELPVSGNKAELIARLEADDESADEDDDTE